MPEPMTLPPRPPVTRHCACVSDDPLWCAAIRYGRPRPTNPDEDEACECICHDEWDEDEEEAEVSEAPVIPVVPKALPKTGDGGTIWRIEESR